MNQRRIPPPSSISPEARAFIESAPPLEPMVITPDNIASGDSYVTNDGVDPTLRLGSDGSGAADAYAGEHDRLDSMISPLHADFAQGFPPTLITTGTRDLLLRDCVRLATRLRAAGVDTRLHVWEAMWHVFEFYPQIPEGRQSLHEIAAFLAAHLAGDSTG